MNELAKGIKTEKEHKDVMDFLERYYKNYGKLPPRTEVYKRISLSHLKEDPKYYSKLLKAKL